MTGKWQQQQQQGLNLLTKIYPIQRVFFHPKKWKYHEKRNNNPKMCVWALCNAKQNENLVDFLHHTLLSFFPLLILFFHQKKRKESNDEIFQMAHTHTISFPCFYNCKKKLNPWCLWWWFSQSSNIVPTICILFFGLKKILKKKEILFKFQFSQSNI